MFQYVKIFIACLYTTWSLCQLVPSLEKFADASSAGSFIFNIMLRVRLSERVTPWAHILYTKTLFLYCYE
jgi:hypothetical protein